MLKPDLVLRLMPRYPHLYQRDIEKVIDTILGQITRALARGGRVELRGFGAFSTKRYKARNGRNPRSGAAVFVPAKALPHFRAGKEMRKLLNNDMPKEAGQ
jgi:integration host factor subunit beta